jgi:type II secretory pathway pseudopilin PulG
VTVRRTRGSGGHGQAGVTLLETLVVTLIVAPLVLAASAGLFSAVSVSEDTEARTELEAALTSYTEAVKDMPYVPCGTPEALQTAYDAWPERWVPDPGSGLPAQAMEVTHVGYWDQARLTFGTTCPGGDGGAQRITLRVADDRGSVVGQLVKRDPDAGPGAAT